MRTMDFDSALKVAVARLGIEELKDKQKEAIESFASGKDVFVALPRGMEREKIFANNPRYVINYALFLLTHAGSATYVHSSGTRGLYAFDQTPSRFLR